MDMERRINYDLTLVSLRNILWSPQTNKWLRQVALQLAADCDPIQTYCWHTGRDRFLHLLNSILCSGLFKTLLFC